MDELTERGKRVIRTDIMVAKYGLNTRQKALVIHLMEQPEADLQSFQASPLCATAHAPARSADGRQGVLLASGATHRKRYRLNDEIV